jgi:predicted pPIWI-associating nuclease
MSSKAPEFLQRVENADRLTGGGLIDFFVYFLTVEEKRPSANATSISNCFVECDFTPPARIAPYLSEGLTSNPQRFVKADRGYKLQRNFRELLAAQFGGDHAELRETPAHLSNNLTGDEKRLLSTIEKLVPSAGVSYRQAVMDLGDENRRSFRGPALELREVLREILDHMAPDKEVLGSQNFQLEKGRTGPTMKQKVRYICRVSRIGKTRASSREDSASAVDAIVGDLTRSIYDRGSLATHVASERGEVLKLKRYVEAVLHDILEIS